MRDRTGRRAVILAALASLAAAPSCPAAGDTVVASPSRAVEFRLVADHGRLTYSVTLRGKRAVEESQLDIRLDGVPLTEGAAIGEVIRYQVDETYPQWGGRATAVNR